MRSVSAFFLLATSYSLAAGCGDVTGDLIVRNAPSPAPSACTGDDGCVPPTGRCELTSGTCVECLENAHCASGDDDDDDDDDAVFCSSAGRCVECLEDGHCDDVGEQCSTFLGACARPCSATSGCGADDDPICDEDIGFCVECRTDLECEEGELCRGSACVD